MHLEVRFLVIHFVRGILKRVGLIRARWDYTVKCPVNHTIHSFSVSLEILPDSNTVNCSKRGAALVYKKIIVTVCTASGNVV